MDKEDEKIWDEYNMDDYDDEPDDIAVNIGNNKFMINKMANYLTCPRSPDQFLSVSWSKFLPFLGSLVVPQNQNEYHHDENGDAADEDDEDITLKENDHVLLAGIDSPDGTANIEVRVRVRIVHPRGWIQNVRVWRC